MESPWLITSATAADSDDLCALVNSAYRGESSRSGWTTEADFLDGQRTDASSLRALIADPARQIILCLREGPLRPILGCVCLEFFNDDDGPGCYLGMLTIQPGTQTKGWGKTLLREGEKFAQTRGAKRMTLTVIQLRESLIAWYERHGYRKTGATKPFPYGRPEFGIPRRPDLHFVVFEKRLPL